ncbi:hypothetical protein RB195_022180 [Necator americanus]|uniref:Uncharacterized protein n=1 Tax=Necator americanus TaxID=51031 RepID=A0ABR1EE98_NECAM
MVALLLFFILSSDSKIIISFFGGLCEEVGPSIEQSIPGFLLRSSSLKAAYHEIDYAGPYVIQYGVRIVDYDYGWSPQQPIH